MMPWIALALTAWMAVEVEVTPLGSPPVSGTLTEWTTDRIILATPAGPRTFDAPTLQVVKVKGGETAEDWKGDLTLELLDGSRLAAESYAAKAGKATGKLRGGRDYEVRTRTVRSVRFRASDPNLDEAWAAQRDAKNTGDVLVIRKTVKGGDQVTLDRQAGIVQDVTAETVQFELDGERIPVKRERLEGIVYFPSTERESPEPACRVEEAGGSVWSVKSVRREGEQAVLETTSGATTSLPLAQLRKIDYSVGNTVYLSDLNPDSAEWTPFVASKSELLTRFNQPRRDALAGGGKLLTGGQTFDKGLAVHSRTSLVYRVPKGFRRFDARIGIDDHVRDLGEVRFVILGDGKTLLETTVTGKESPATSPWKSRECGV